MADVLLLLTVTAKRVAGSRTVNTEPLPGSLVTVTSPPQNHCLDSP